MTKRSTPPPEARPSRLPALGRKGEGWVVLQVIFLVAIVVVGLAGPPWPGAAKLWLGLAAGIAAVGGLCLLGGGEAGLGQQLTANPKPVEDGALRQHGVYRLVRHPMYGGVLLVALAWALVSSPLTLVPVVVAAAFLDAKRRREEAWLLEQYPDYADYRRRVRRQFIPFAW